VKAIVTKRFPHRSAAATREICDALTCDSLETNFAELRRIGTGRIGTLELDQTRKPVVGPIDSKGDDFDV
jgi:hypothetical protein